MAAEMYLASVMLVDDQQDAERGYLDELAAALKYRSRTASASGAAGQGWRGLMIVPTLCVTEMPGMALASWRRNAQRPERHSHKRQKSVSKKRPGLYRVFSVFGTRNVTPKLSAIASIRGKSCGTLS